MTRLAEALTGNDRAAAVADAVRLITKSRYCRPELRRARGQRAALASEIEQAAERYEAARRLEAASPSVADLRRVGDDLDRILRRLLASDPAASIICALAPPVLAAGPPERGHSELAAWRDRLTTARLRIEKVARGRGPITSRLFGHPAERLAADCAEILARWWKTVPVGDGAGGCNLTAFVDAIRIIGGEDCARSARRHTRNAVASTGRKSAKKLGLSVM